MPPPIESDGEDEVAANDLETQGTAPPPTSNDKCMGALPLGIPKANALRGKYPVMRHAYEKVHWRYVDGMGIVSLDPPCTGKARSGSGSSTSGSTSTTSSSSNRSSNGSSSSSSQKEGSN